jgi:hypothetical protein
MTYATYEIEHFLEKTGIELIGNKKTWTEEIIGRESYDWPHYCEVDEVERSAMVVSGFTIDLNGAAITSHFLKTIYYNCDDVGADENLLFAIKQRLGNINYGFLGSK